MQPPENQTPAMRALVALRARIELAHEAPFALAGLAIDPAQRTIRLVDDAAQQLEPRVMQVLIALVRAGGSAMTREDLVECCWDGLNVGDDAISRVIVKLRRLGEATGQFTVETLPRVGYRLRPNQEMSGVAPADEPLSGLTAELSTISPVTKETVLSPDRSKAASTPLRPYRKVAGALAIGAVVLLTVLGSRALGTRNLPPIIEVEPFSVNAPGVPAGLVDEVRVEIADFLANEKFYLVTTPRKAGGSAPDWRVRGTIAPADNGRRVVVFAELLRQGSEVSVARLRVNRDVRQPMLARSLGLRIGRTSGCILLTVTNPELTGGFSEAALPALAASCITWHEKTSSIAARIGRFRDTAAAFPKSAYFRARLGELLGDAAIDNAADAAALRAQGASFVAAAEAIDPGQPHIILARARLLPPADLVGRERLLKKALGARPSDCACEFGDYSMFLSSVGRNAEARAFAMRAREKEPKNIPWLRRAGETAAVMGDYETANYELAQVAGYLPDPSNLDTWRMNLGIWSQDWQLADDMAQRQPDKALRALQSEFVAAYKSGGADRIYNVGHQMMTRSKSDVTNDRATVTMLAMAGMTEEAVVAADNFLSRHPSNIALLFEPSFADARKTPSFQALSTKLGLLDYWLKSGHPPDFCGAQNAPPLCKQFGSR